MTSSFAPTRAVASIGMLPSMSWLAPVTTPHLRPMAACSWDRHENRWSSSRPASGMGASRSRSTPGLLIEVTFGLRPAMLY